MKHLLYGVAYYDEYMPYDRLDKDIQMMKKAGINLVRIAESTWSTLEPQENEFNFYHIDRVLNKMEEAGISVLIGTPTYAIPSWLVRKHPDIMVITKNGRKIYGARQIMDITNPTYRFYCERVIRNLLEHVKNRQCVIGFQIDNETKHFGTSAGHVQHDFVQYLKRKFNDDIEAMNHEYGLNYWSNAVHSWEDFPDIRGTVNASLGSEFERFQRGLVTEFLAWQAAIVNEYKRPDQFITHNFDFEWKYGSYGVQADADHFSTSKCLDITGCDIYHPTQEKLTGSDIAFCGDLSRCYKQDNYLVLETQAQGFPEWEPFDGQLRIQAFSHLASGADCVEYWHWHSIHNSVETYWRGLLSHDMEENSTYREAVGIGNDFKRLSSHLLHLKKNNKIAVMVNNESLTGLKWFPIGEGLSYNDVVRWMYDGLYEMNYECDVINTEEEHLEKYKMILLPALYCVSEETLERLYRFTENGGCLIGTFKTAFCNENVRVYNDHQPHKLSDCFGIYYQHFTKPGNVGLEGEICEKQQKAEKFMECLVPAADDTEILLRYVHDNWGQYAAVTKHAFGKGMAYYFGCMFDKELLKKTFKKIVEENRILSDDTSNVFPIIVKKGINQDGKRICYIFNYSGKKQMAACPTGRWKDLLTYQNYCGEEIELDKWGVAILEETAEREDK